MLNDKLRSHQLIKDGFFFTKRSPWIETMKYLLTIVEISRLNTVKFNFSDTID